MAVLARFWVQSVKKTTISNGEINREVVLQAVVRASGLPGAQGNIQWAKYTPSGNITLQVNAEDAGQWFEDRIGKDVSITFEDPED